MVRVCLEGGMVQKSHGQQEAGDSESSEIIGRSSKLVKLVKGQTI